MSDEKKVIGRPFPKGVSGNPGGRSPLEKIVQEVIGEDLPAILYVKRCVALGIPPDPDHLVKLGIELSAEQRKAMEATFASIKVRDVNDASKDLEDRGWGKPKQKVKITGNATQVPKNIRELSVDELRIAAKLDEGLGDDGDDDVPGDGVTQH